MWSLAIFGPSDLERSIVESALRQAGYHVQVIQNADEAELFLQRPRVEAVLTTGLVPGWEEHHLNPALEALSAARIAPVVLRDPGQTEGLPEGVKLLMRPIQFPAAALELGDQIRSWFEVRLCAHEPLTRDSLKKRLKTAERIEATGIFIVQTAMARGEVHLKAGKVVQARFGSLSGPEAFAVHLGLSTGETFLEPRKSPEAGQGRGLKSWITESESIELQVAHLLDGAPTEPLDVAAERLLSRLSLLSDQVSWILRLIDGKRDLKAIRMLGGRRALEGALSLLQDGILVVGEASVAEEPPPVSDEEDGPELPPQIEDDDIQDEGPSELSNEEFAWSLAMAQVPDSASPQDWESLPELQDEDLDQWGDGPIEPLLEEASEDSLLFTAPPVESDAPPFFEEIDDQLLQQARGVTGDGLPPVVEDGLPPPLEEGVDPFLGGDEVPSFLETRDMAPLTEALPTAPPPQPRRRSQLRTSDEIAADLEAQTTSHEALEGPRLHWKWPVLAVLLFSLVVLALFMRHRRIRGAKDSLLSPILRTFSDSTPLPPLEKTSRPEAQDEPEEEKNVVRLGKKKSRKKKRRLGTGPFAKAVRVAREARDQGDVDKAVAEYRKAVKMRAGKKNKAVVYAELGEALETNGDTTAARKAYSRAIAANSKLVVAYKALGYLELKAFKNNDVSARKRAQKQLRVAKKLLGSIRDPELEGWLEELE